MSSVSLPVFGTDSRTPWRRIYCICHGFSKGLWQP